MDRDYSQYLTRKNVILTCLGFVVVVLGLLFSQNGVVVITTDQPAEVVISNPNKTYQETEQLSAGSSKILLLQSNLYSVKVTSKNNQTSLYQKRVPGFSITNFKVSFVPQQQSIGLGAAEPGCVALTKNTKLASFYQCPDSTTKTPGLLVTSDGQNFASLADQLGNRPGQSLPYGDGSFLVAYRDEGSSRFLLQKVSSSELLAAPQNFNPARSLSPSQLTGSSQVITDQSVSRTSVFIIKNDSEIFIFKNVDHSSPQKIDLEPYLKTSHPYYPRVQLVNDKIYVYLGALDSEGDSEAKKTVLTPQKFYVFSAQSGRLLQEHAVPDTIRLMHYSVAAGGSIALETHDLNDPVNQFSIITRDSLRKQPLFNYSPGNSCWAEDQLYFIDRDGKGIYRFNPRGSVSHLVYEASGSKLSGLECLYGQVYVNSYQQTDDSGVYPAHLILASAPLNSSYKRPSDIFPIEGAQEVSIALGDYYQDTVRLVMLGEYDADGNCVAKVGEGEARARSYLSSRGLDVAAFKYAVTYQCASATGE